LRGKEEPGGGNFYAGPAQEEEGSQVTLGRPRKVACCSRAGATNGRTSRAFSSLFVKRSPRAIDAPMAARADRPREGKKKISNRLRREAESHERLLAGAQEKRGGGKGQPPRGAQVSRSSTTFAARQGKEEKEERMAREHEQVTASTTFTISPRPTGGKKRGGKPPPLR